MIAGFGRQQTMANTQPATQIASKAVEEGEKYRAAPDAKPNATAAAGLILRQIT